MRKNDIGFGFGKTGDSTPRRQSERDAKRGNEAVAFARFYDEYVKDRGHSLATVAEVRAAFEAERRK